MVSRWGCERTDGIGITTSFSSTECHQWYSVNGRLMALIVRYAPPFSFGRLCSGIKSYGVEHGTVDDTAEWKPTPPGVGGGQSSETGPRRVEPRYQFVRAGPRRPSSGPSPTLPGPTQVTGPASTSATGSVRRSTGRNLISHDERTGLGSPPTSRTPIRGDGEE